ncbi:MAG: RDD family protein, partial [Nocardioides sp.]
MSSPEFAMLTEDDLVTGEAVALDLPPASVGARIASGLIDVLALAAVGTCVLFLALVSSIHADGALQHVALVGSLMVVFLVYPTTVETLTRGRSPGKLALGLRVVRDDAGTVTAQQAFVRALVGIVEIYALSGGPAFFSCLVSARGKRLGDYAAGTYVVRDRVRLSLPPPPAMPPALTAWAAGADLAAPPV